LHFEGLEGSLQRLLVLFLEDKPQLFVILVEFEGVDLQNFNLIAEFDN